MTIQTDPSRRFITQVDHPASNERAAVVDPYDNTFAAGEQRDTHPGPEREAFVGGGELVVVKDLSAGGTPAVPLRPVMGGQTDKVPPLPGLWICPASAKHQCKCQDSEKRKERSRFHKEMVAGWNYPPGKFYFSSSERISS